MMTTVGADLINMIPIRQNITGTAAAISWPEIEMLITIAEKINPRIVIDVGLFRCGLTKIILEELKPELYIGIDNNKRPEDIDVVESPSVRLLWEHDSTDNKTVQEVADILGGRTVGFLFIDGGHTEPVVRSDWKNYSGFVREGGIVGFHDIHLNSSGGQIAPLWHELKKTYKNMEFSLGNETTGVGILFNKEVTKIIE